MMSRMAAPRSLLLLVVLLAAGCAATPERTTEPPAAVPATATPADERGVEIVRRAEALIGTPYRYGGADPQGFDCSGLVRYVFAGSGVDVPRTAAEQQVAARPVPDDDLEPGDLVFFRMPETHVGIYAGDGTFIHAPRSGRPVTRARIDDPYYILNFAGAGRLLPPN
jgi:cell wall-associated NlpC family hydrolase